jgi:hypothetical protein
VRVTSRASRSALTGPVLLGVLLFAIGALSLTALVRGSRVPLAEPAVDATEPADSAPRYTGSIVVPTTGTNSCRHLLFDNATGQIREVEAAPCGDLAPDINSTEGRIGAIRRSFAKQPDSK